MTIVKVTYVGGFLGDNKNEDRVDKLFLKNAEAAHELYPDDELIITESPIPSFYRTKFESINALGKHQYGARESQQAALRSVPREKYDSLISADRERYFASRKGITVGSTESMKKAVRQVITKTITTDALAAAKVASQTAFYGAMFLGVNNFFGLNSGLLENIFPLIPDVLLASTPFFSVQRLERGMSDRLLKYRAIGDVFLAHQRGATDTLRLDMTLIGPYRGWYLLWLLMLQGKGEGQLQNLLNLGSGPDTGDISPHETIKIPKDGTVQYETHITFPIITKTAFMLDMFLQTIEWHQEKDRGGHEVIYIHLLFRKHIDPKGYKIFERGGKKKGILHYGETQDERLRKELIYDTIWKARQIGNEIFNVGMFGASNMFEIDMEAISTVPYITDVAKLAAGYTYDINNLHSEETYIEGVPHAV